MPDPISTIEAVKIITAFVNEIFHVENNQHEQENSSQARTILIESLRKGKLTAHYLESNTTVPISAHFWAGERSLDAIIQSKYFPNIDNPTVLHGRARACLITVDHADVDKMISSLSSSSLESMVTPADPPVTTPSRLAPSPHQGAASPSRAGRKPKYDWEEVMFRILVVHHEQGLPHTKAEFFRRVAEALGDDAPTDTMLKQRTNRVFDEMTNPGSGRRKSIPT